MVLKVRRLTAELDAAKNEIEPLKELFGLCWAVAVIHDQPSNICFVEKKAEKKAQQKQMKMQKQRNLLCFCILFAFFLVPLLHL